LGGGEAAVPIGASEPSGDTEGVVLIPSSVFPAEAAVPQRRIDLGNGRAPGGNVAPVEWPKMYAFIQQLANEAQPGIPAWETFAAICKRTPMPVTRNSIAPAASLRSPVRDMRAARSLTCTRPRRASPVTTELLERIGGLFAVEKKVRGQPPNIRRAAARQIAIQAQLDELKARMEEIRAKLSAKSALAVAISYALKRWLALTRYLDDGHLEIDNLIGDGVSRREFAPEECARRPEQPAVPAHPCSDINCPSSDNLRQMAA
jgi:Transposase IS66 family